MSLSRSAFVVPAALSAGLFAAPCLAGDLPPRHGSLIPDAVEAPGAPAPIRVSEVADAPVRQLPPLRLRHAAYPGALRDRAGLPVQATPDLPNALMPREGAPLLEVTPPSQDPPRWRNPGAVSL